MKHAVFSVLALSFFLGGCQSVPPAPVVPPQARELPQGTQTIPSQPPVSSRIIDITTRNWAFSPANISVRKGEKVTLRIIGEEGVHGFAVPDFGINKTVRPGEVVSVDLPTDATGSYRFFCSVQCGQGHIDMNGEIIIEP